MVLVIVEPPDALWSRHHIQIIHIIAMGGCDRVVSARDQYDIGIMEAHGLIDRPVIGIDALEGKSLRGIDAVVIGFLQHGFMRQIVPVVLVGRIA